MTRTGFRLQNGHALSGLDGSLVGVTPDGQIDAIGGIRRTEHGVAAGPLELQPYKDTTAVLDSFTYTVARNASSGLSAWGASILAAAGLPLAAPDRETAAETDHRCTRRDMLKLTAAAGGAYAITGSAVAAESPPLLDVAEFDLVQNPRGVRLQILDLVPEVLNITERYHVTVDGAEFEDFHADGGHVNLPPGVTGTISVHTEAEREYWDRIRAWYGAPDDTHQFKYTLDKPASEYEQDTIVELADEPHVVEPLRDAGGDDSTVKITGTSVPHKDESDEPVGQYFINADDTLVYAAGKDPPENDIVTIKIEVGRMTEALDDASRATQF